MDKELPSAQWIKERIFYASDRVRMLRTGNDLENVMRYLSYRSRGKKILSVHVIQEALRILPALNLSVTDEAGFYSGHSLVLPLREESYYDLRERRRSAEQLMPEDLTDHRLAERPVFFSYNMAADNNDNVYLLLGAVLCFLQEWNEREYIWCALTDRYDTYYLHAVTGLQVVWEDSDQISPFGAPYRFVEGDLKEFLKNKES